jgi:hypothetical protein
LLIFVFARVSCGLRRAILAEFAAVPNDQPLVSPDVRPTPAQPSPVVPTPVAPASSPRDRIEIGGPKGPEPTRFGDWERNGRCVDF